MIRNVIAVGKEEDRIVNIVKAKYGLKNKSQAVALIVRAYGESFLEPEIRPEYIEKLERIKKEKGIKFSSVEELRKIIES